MVNPITNELRLFARDNNIPDDFIPIPGYLQNAAKKKLAGKQSAHVSFTSGGKLSKWAADQRKKKRKEAKESRRRNRRG